jgi:hypothetical protein
VEVDGKQQEWKFCGDARKHYCNNEDQAYTAATVHQDWVYLAEEDNDDTEMWLIGSGATANVTASKEEAKNVTRSKRHVRVGNGATCHVAEEGNFFFHEANKGITINDNTDCARVCQEHINREEATGNGIWHRGKRKMDVHPRPRRQDALHL